MKNFLRFRSPRKHHNDTSSTTDNNTDNNDPYTEEQRNIEITGPFDVKHQIHVDFDTENGLSGVPKEWAPNLEGLDFTIDELSITTDQLQKLQKFEQEQSPKSKKNDKKNHNRNITLFSKSSNRLLTGNNNQNNNISSVNSSFSSSTGSLNSLLLDNNNNNENNNNNNNCTSPTLPSSPTTSSSTINNFTINKNINFQSFYKKNNQSMITLQNEDEEITFINPLFDNNNTNLNENNNSEKISLSKRFQKFIKKKDNNSINGSNNNEEQQQLTFSFKNMKRTQAGYYVDSSELNGENNSSNNTIFNNKKQEEMKLIDLINPMNPFQLFTKLKKIGTGSTADVYKGIHIPSGKKVAIKVMSFYENKNNNFDMIENEIYMMNYACKNYKNISEYDYKTDNTFMVNYFDTFYTVNHQIALNDSDKNNNLNNKKKEEETNVDCIQRYISEKSLKSNLKKNSKKKKKNDLFINNSKIDENNINLLLSYQKKSYDELFVVMEYVSGGKLTDLLHVTFLESEIAAILKPILKALQILHKEYGVIHRDIKSDNVLITRDGKIKLADFGFCAENNGKRRSVVGTPYWMSPEIVMANPYDEKTDVWSFGIMVLELANGDIPLIEHPPIKALFLIRQQDPPTFKNPSQWSDTFKDFLSKCLQKDPKERASVDELLEHSFIKQACSLDFLLPVLERVRNEKRKIKEEEIGLQKIKVRDSTSSNEEEGGEKKKKGGFGLMGIIPQQQPQQKEENDEMDNVDVAVMDDDYGGGDDMGGDYFDDDLI